MNWRGSYTAMVGLMVILLMVSMTFFMTTTAGSQKNFIVIKEAGDLKRTFNNARHLVDRSVSYAMAEHILDGFRLDDSCVAGGDFGPIVAEYMTALSIDLERETGFDCLMTTPAHIYDNNRFNVRMVCSRVSSKGVQGFYSVSTADSFSLAKNVTADINVFASPLTCSVTVSDVDSGLIEVTDSAVQLP